MLKSLVSTEAIYIQVTLGGLSRLCLYIYSNACVTVINEKQVMTMKEKTMGAVHGRDLREERGGANDATIQ